jgi:hypothetical protein
LIVATPTPLALPFRGTTEAEQNGVGTPAVGLPMHATYVQAVTFWLKTSYRPVPTSPADVVPCERARLPLAFRTAVILVTAPSGRDGRDARAGEGHEERGAGLDEPGGRRMSRNT